MAENLDQIVQSLSEKIRRMQTAVYSIEEAQKQFSYIEFQKLKQTFEDAADEIAKTPALVEALAKSTDSLAQVSAENLKALEAQRLSLEFAEKTLQTLEVAEQQALADFIRPISGAASKAVLEIHQAINEIRLEGNAQLKREVERVTLNAFKASQNFFEAAAKREFENLAIQTAKSASERFYSLSGFKNDSDACAQALAFRAENQLLKHELESLKKAHIEIRDSSQGVLSRLKNEVRRVSDDSEAEAKKALYSISSATKNLREAKDDLAVTQAGVGVRDLVVFGLGLAAATVLLNYTQVESAIKALF